MNIIGRVYQLPESIREDVNTDIIIAGRHLRVPIPELGNHAFEGVVEDFPKIAKEHPVLVAGANFGCGSSREQAVHALLGSGVKMVIARSFGFIFSRNSFNLGLPLLQLDDPSMLDVLITDSEVQVDLVTGQLICNGKQQLQGGALSDHLLNILQAGGIMNLISQDA